jgi:PPOX class probable F420-dependent enzyme
MPSKHEVTRLKRELVIWIVTVGRDVHPHAVPVWFWWDGESFLIYAVPGQKVRDMQANPNVALHLNTDPVGEDVVRIDGMAKIDPKHPPASKVAGYLQVPRAHPGHRYDPPRVRRAVPPRDPRPPDPLPLTCIR